MAKILVIDDERSIRNTLKEILEYEKFTVDLAENGIEGLEKYKAGNYDIVLCDIKMPEMDGLEVLEKLFQEEGEAQVIMISGHGSVDNAVEAIKKGIKKSYGDKGEKIVEVNSRAFWLGRAAGLFFRGLVEGGLAALPAISALDVRRRALQAGLADALIDEVEKTLQASRQVLLFLARAR